MQNWYKNSKQFRVASANPNANFQSFQEYLKGMQEMRAKFAGTNGLAYTSMEDFLLKHGTRYLPQPLTDEELKAVKELIGKGGHFEAKQCFYNSGTLSASSVGTLQYVEGYCMSDRIPIPIHHAWNAINGKVIDVTYKHLNDGKPILGVFPEDWIYFGTPFSRKSIVKIWSRTGCSYAMLDYPVNMDLFQRPFDAQAEDHLSDDFYKKKKNPKKNNI